MPREISKAPRPDFFAQGGGGKMFERGTAHPAVPFISGKESNGGASGEKAERKGEGAYGKDVRYAEGGSTKMFGKGHAGKKIPFVSGKESQEG
jgi:hypothetical protein